MKQDRTRRMNVIHTFMQIIIPFHLSDEELLDVLARLAANERGAVAELVAHLAALDTRGAHLALGYSSLFSYCREALRLSEHEAYNRIEVARAARRFPEVLGMLHDGSLTTTAARLLAPVLTAENRERLLAAAAYRSKREVEELIARTRPRPDVPASIRKVPVPHPIVRSNLPEVPAQATTETASPPSAGSGAGARPLAGGSGAGRKAAIDHCAALPGTLRSALHGEGRDV